MKSRIEGKSKLKPCPFCGNEQVGIFVSPIAGTNMIICEKCGADVCFFGAECRGKAITAWNRRKGGESDA